MLSSMLMHIVVLLKVQAADMYPPERRLCTDCGETSSDIIEEARKLEYRQQNTDIVDRTSKKKE